MKDTTKGLGYWTAFAEKGIEYLAETDRQLAELSGKYERDKKEAEKIFSKLYLSVNGTVEERKAKVKIHADYDSAREAEITSLIERDHIKHKRATAINVIDFWRSYQKAVNEGHV